MYPQIGQLMLTLGLLHRNTFRQTESPARNQPSKAQKLKKTDRQGIITKIT